MSETKAILNSDRVHEILLDCLFKDDEDPTNHVKAEGIRSVLGFHPERLESHKTEIIAMLDELPDQFHQRKGGCWTFLNACQDKHGNQWTGLHMVMEELVVLGIAIGKMEFCMPRKDWSIFPGGMPYFVVKE